MFKAVTPYGTHSNQPKDRDMGKAQKLQPRNSCAARYEYDPFSRPLRIDLPLAAKRSAFSR
jgi:hypothetical protein